MAGRVTLGALVAVVTLLAVGLGALIGGPDGGGVLAVVTRASEGANGTVVGVAGAVPFAYAFAAGVLAALNPCGIALLPSYVSLQARQVEPGDRTRAFAVAARFGLATALGVVALFLGFGLLIAAVGNVVSLVFPWVGLVAGVVLVGVAAHVLAGGSVTLSWGMRMAGRMGAAAGSPGVGGGVAYGVGYGLASLGCTLPIFLTVLVGALSAGGPIRVLLEFVLYGLGLGLVLSVLALTGVAFGTAVPAVVRRAGAYLPVVSGVLLLAAGAYLVYYWLTVGGVLARVLA